MHVCMSLDDGGMNLMNVDLSDPEALQKVMAQIQDITKQNKNKKKEEL